MPAPIVCFFLGCVAGLRSLTAPAVACWATHFGWLSFPGSKLALIGHPLALTISTLLALVELVLDKLPRTPARTAPIGLVARIILGGACGLVVAIAAGISRPIGLALGSAGALVAAFAGYYLRSALVFRAHLPDFVVALAEDVIAISGGLLVASRF
ncbi:MAG TPA: DUF4126 family protein [Terriglobales bacterium]|nr:DUF4126 family protein [Terriglobales bacterium]